MQRQLPPSVTPRPAKQQASHRSGRTYTATAPSPAKSASQYEVALRPAEAASPVVSPRLRKKPIIVSGDIRNLDSNFAVAMSRAPVGIREVQRVFRTRGISVSNDEAQTLVHEYEESNDRAAAYEPFVDELVQLLRQHKQGVASARLQHKKTRLAEHMRLLDTMQSQLMDALSDTLKDRLRVAWPLVRDAFRRADTARRGRLARAQFVAICASLDIPIEAVVVDAFVVDRADEDSLDHNQNHNRDRSNDLVDYNAFLAHYGSAFQHGDTNSVGFSLIYARPSLHDADASPSTPPTSTNHTLQSPGVTHALNSKSPRHKKPTVVAGASAVAGTSPTKASAAEPYSSSARPIDPLAMEKLRILLNDKIAARHKDVKKAFMAVDRDGNGVISAAEFDRVLREFHLAVGPEELEALLDLFDTNRDGAVDYHEFFTQFGDVHRPSASRPVMENSSLVFGGDRDIKGANKNRLALSSPGNELKEAFSRLADESWRAIYVELDASDVKKTGVVPSAELLRVLAKYLGELPRHHYASLFRACGSHTNQLLNYRQLVKSYRQHVMDPIEYFHQDTHAITEKTFRKSPTESLVMVWSIRVLRAQMPPLEWLAMKEDLWRADSRRVGRILASQFMSVVKNRMKVSEDQAAFLSFFYEDKNLSADQVTIRYGSFLTDYEDSGLEDPEMSKAPSTRKPSKDKTEAKGRVRPPGYGIHNSHHHGAPHYPAAETLARDEEEKKLRHLFAVHIQALEAQLQELDVEKRGFVSLDAFFILCKELHGGKLKETSTAFCTLVNKYVAQKNFYYRGFLLDFDTRAGLQGQALVVQDDDDDEESEDREDGGDVFPGDADGFLLDVHQAKDALRHHLTVSLSRQKVVYKVLQRMDPGKSGVLGYAELRRALERLDIHVDDETAHEWCGSYEEEDETTGQRTGRIKYLLLLHAHGGRDPDKVDGMSDLSSNCSYYSAISISPRAVVKGGASGRPPASRDQHAVAARAVSNAIDKPRPLLASSGLSGAAAAAAVERKIQTQLEAPGKRGKWKQLARAFQQIDNDRRGAVSLSSFRKVLEDAGVHLDQEDLVRLQLKYDIDQNGKLSYHEFLRNLTNAMSDLPRSQEDTGVNSATQKLPTISSPFPRQGRGLSTGGGVVVGLSEQLRQGVKAKWKAIYASLKTLDKANVGRVSAPHFRQLLEWYALAVADDEFLQLLRLFDHDDDGGVDYNKFMKACFT